MANNFGPVGNEIQVNLAPNQNLSQFEPDVASLIDGRFLVVFTDLDASQKVIGQFVNGDGTLSGGNIDIEVGAVTGEFEPRVAQRIDGGALVAWTDASGASEIHYAAVSSAGVVGAEQTILSGGLGVFDSDVATLADGRSLVVAIMDGAVSEDVVFRFVDSGGAPAGTQDFIDDDANGQFEPALAASGNTALVVYIEQVALGDVNVLARFYDGSNFAAEITIDDTGLLDDPEVAALADGRFVVVYEDFEDSALHGRFVSAAGAPGAAFDIPDLGGDNRRPHVAGLPDGGFIVAWDSDAGVFPSDDDDDIAVFAQRFDATGTAVGDIFLVNQGDAGDQDSPVVAVNGAGQALIVWSDGFPHPGPGEDNDPGGIRGHAFVTTTDVVNGTDLSDIIRTYDLGEPINGLAGDDLIIALGGDDIVHGGSGFDHIKGGLGNDQLFGESGEDLLKGEEGDDLLVGGLGRDLQIGGAGKDTFDFNKAAESRVGANHDLVKGFSHAEHDRLNLQTIDADKTAGGNQAFDFVGAGAFTGTAGELRLAGGFLQGDTNGDGVADFEVKVTGIGAGSASDFVL